MPYATMRDGARLHYYDLGSKRSARTCVLLHGFAMPAALWIPFVAPQLHRARFILPDLRGFGGSHRLKLSQPTLLNQHADDVADLFEQLDLRNVHLGGLSMGACTSLQFHRRYGFSRVRAYLHIDQSPRVINAADWPHGLLGEQQAEGFAEMNGLRSYLHDDYDWRDTLPRIEVPMTALVGMQSTMYPAPGQLAIRELVPHANVVEIHDCGHAVPFEQPRRFVSELGHFLMAA